MDKNFLLKLESVTKYYSVDAGLKIYILEDINFEIPVSESGSVTTILAPAGSGKTTLLKIISGLTEFSSGKITLDSEKKNTLPYIPEKPSSFPWLNVKENIELVINHSEEKKYKFNELISLVGLTGYEDHFPHNKSIGFRFRISLARALALSPPLIIIDDSFKLIKEDSSEEIYSLVKSIVLKEKQCFILATTNISEAIMLSDNIILMSKKPGKIIKQIVIDNEEKHHFFNIKSEKFTVLKNEIENAFVTKTSL